MHPSSQMHTPNWQQISNWSSAKFVFLWWPSSLPASSWSSSSQASCRRTSFQWSASDTHTPRRSRLCLKKIVRKNIWVKQSIIIMLLCSLKQQKWKPCLDREGNKNIFVIIFCFLWSTGLSKSPWKGCAQSMARWSQYGLLKVTLHLPSRLVKAKHKVDWNLFSIYSLSRTPNCVRKLEGQINSGGG